MDDLLLVGLGATTVVSLVVAVLAFLRTRDVKVLEKLVTEKTGDAELTTALEKRFARLSPTAQEAIFKLIRVADPLTDFWPSDLDDRVVAWVKEITDGTPLKDKPAPQ